jgi:beta-barrel assembly-enhancing protease
VTFEPRTPREDVNVSPTHPLVEAGWLIGAALLAGVLLAALAFGVAEVVCRWLPPDLEVRIFADAFDVVADGAAAEETPRSRAARDLTERLAAHWSANPYRFRVFVVDAPEPNAFALPGGGIGLTRGLLDHVENENELAFVIGHEIGHFAARDHIRALGRGLVLSLLLQSVGLFGASDAVPGLASDLASRGFARDQEREADAFALDLVAKEYGHAGGADGFFGRLPDAKARFGDRAAVWFHTHPLTEARIRALHERAAERSVPLAGELRALPPAPPPETDAADADESRDG